MTTAGDGCSACKKIAQNDHVIMLPSPVYVVVLFLVVLNVNNSAENLFSYGEYSNQYTIYQLENADQTNSKDCGAVVNCHPNEMSIALSKAFLSGVSLGNLGLLDPSCKAVDNNTHFTFTTSLIGCGTLSKHIDASVVYSNVVRHVVPPTAIITRTPQVKIHFSCHYSKYGVVSTGEITNGNGQDTTYFESQRFEPENNVCQKERLFSYFRNPTCPSRLLARSRNRLKHKGHLNRGNE
ncbi:CUB and zona pellucida-like domain-containing protein 1 [Montipora capricornis]|uniref:CUB and zona pellucida-like domain-containing protein 1 n=1 Tax=Montipora capricornis TaxID=246305 RepID=UPI0035F209DE